MQVCQQDGSCEPEGNNDLPSIISHRKMAHDRMKDKFGAGFYAAVEYVDFLSNVISTDPTDPRNFQIVSSRNCSDLAGRWTFASSQADQHVSGAGPPDNIQMF